MRNGTYTAKRRASSQEWRGNATRDFGATGNSGTFGGFSRNHNITKFSGTGSIGKISTVGFFVASLFALALVYVSTSARATSYDYELANLSDQIEAWTAREQDLKIEKERLTSIANSNNSKVAAAMEDAGETEFAE